MVTLVTRQVDMKLMMKFVSMLAKCLLVSFSSVGTVGLRLDEGKGPGRQGCLLGVF